MVDFFQSYESSLRYVLGFENFSETPEFPIDTWRWLDYFLEKPLQFPTMYHGLVRLRMPCFTLRCIVTLRLNRISSCNTWIESSRNYDQDEMCCGVIHVLNGGKKGKSRKEISEIDPWGFY